MAMNMQNAGAEPALARGDAAAAKGDFAGAVAAYREALKHDERSVAAYRKLIGLFRDSRHGAHGLEAAQRLLALEPRSVYARAAVADMLEMLGRLDEAYAMAAPAVNAGQRDAYLITVFGRICGRMEPPRDEAIEPLGRVAADAKLAPRTRVKALWALVHSLDALGRYAESFARAQELKALEKRSGISRPMPNWKGIDAAVRAYTPERMARLPRASHGSRLPIFVVGMLRSGTTLTEQILSAHPDVHGAGELPDLARMALRKIPAKQPYPACLDALDQAALDALAAEQLARLRKAAPKARHVVDKMPTNFEHLGLIELLFPQARVIHCTRDPLDTCLSVYYLPDTSCTNTLEEVAEMYRRYQRIMAHWRGVLRVPMLELRYEEVVADPERKVRELLEFCGLPWNDACLAFHKSGRQSRNFSYHQVRKPIYSGSVGRARHYEKQLAPLQAALAAGSRGAAPTAQVAAEHFARARELANRGDNEAAVASYRAAIAADPKLVVAYNNLGNLLTGMDRAEEALEPLRRALELKPDYALAQYNVGNALKKAGRHDEAIRAYERALELKPGYPEALNNLANTLNDANRLPEAEATLRKAIASRPDFAEAVHNLAGTVRDLGRIEESIPIFQQALAINPKLADSHFGVSLMLMLVERYAEAWPHYEWRFRWSAFPGRKQMLPGPQWKGERFDGKTLLVYFEQGLGDTIQFVRYAPLIAARGGQLVMEVQKSLMRLCAPLGRYARFIAGGERRPHYDLQCPLQSVTLAFNTTVDTIPPAPYLTPDPALVAKWRERIGGAPGLKVGLIWAGNPKQPSEPKRGVGMQNCLPLFATPGVRWVSLQVGEKASEVLLAPPGTISDVSPELTDFAETAAVMANLDLVISTDTAPAHLAGALGVPTFLMLRDLPDWRWHLERADCPWYPSMRLFRQKKPGDWATVVAEVKAALVAQMGK
jgi:tetratricopeptide (TPR) repeat protein